MKTKTKPKKAERNGVAARAIDPYDAMTSSDVAIYLQVPESAVIEEATSGRLPGRRLGGEWRFVRMAIVDWLRAGSPPKKSSKDRILAMAGVWADDPASDELIESLERMRKNPLAAGE